MNKQITPSVRYIGADDNDLDLFEGQYIIPNGISYNSYLIVDEKIAVLETIDARKTADWLANLEEGLGGRKPDYLIVSHMEPDHASNVRLMLEKYPDVAIVCTAAAVKLITRFFGMTPKNLQIVKEGDTLSLGQHTLQFVMAPMVHWPEVMMEYEQTEKILFSADGFGKFGALSYNDPEGWACEARRYYFNICGKYGMQVQNVLKKASALDIQKICPLHGPVLEGEEMKEALRLYDIWSSYRPENEGVFIAYCSLHGNTETAALKLGELIKEENPDLKVSVSDLRRDDMAEAIEDAFRYDRLVVAAPTYDNGLMPIMHDFLYHLQIKNFQKRRVAIVENGSWAPVAGKVMREELEKMKEIEVVEPIVTVPSVLTEGTIEELRKLASALA